MRERKNHTELLIALGYRAETDDEGFTYLWKDYGSGIEAYAEGAGFAVFVNDESIFLIGVSIPETHMTALHNKDFATDDEIRAFDAYLSQLYMEDPQ